jgi:RNA polymerase sigma-70 factor (ECF subfamily)
MDERESRLVEMVLRGNSEAFEPLVTPYRKLLLNMAYRLSRNWEDAREISQETLFRAFRYLRSFDPKRSFKNWLIQIMMNVWRSSKPRPLEPESLPEVAAASPLGNPLEARLCSETRSQILACLEGLSPKEREVFLLRDIEEMNVKETARALGISALSVRVRLSSARKKIRLRIEKEFPHLLEGRR